MRSSADLATDKAFIGAGNLWLLRTSKNVAQDIISVHRFFALPLPIDAPGL
ncbi:MAG: hypothetical protein H0X40_01655 [Chthoniobacterales bacterium]|nr:hypothetical protein [Chthoniobacterales bacterium]